MSTAQQPQQAAQVTSEETVLDRTLEATSKRRSLTATAAAVLGVAPEKLCGLLRNVWQTSKGSPPLTDQEMFQGISMIARYELDPIAREVYVTRTSKGLVTIIGLDGWIKILDRTDHYNGFTVEIHEDDKGVVQWVETAIHSTKREHPAVYRAYAAEYRKVAGVVANSLPVHMLRIFSLRHAARLFVPLSGQVMTEEEAAYMDRRDHDSRFHQDIDDMINRHKQTPPEAAQSTDTSDDDALAGAIGRDGAKNARDFANSLPPMADDDGGPQDQQDEGTLDDPSMDTSEGPEGAAESPEATERQREAFTELERRMNAVRVRSGLDKAWDAVQATWGRQGLTKPQYDELGTLYMHRADEMAGKGQPGGQQKTAF